MPKHFWHKFHSSERRIHCCARAVNRPTRVGAGFGSDFVSPRVDSWITLRSWRCRDPQSRGGPTLVAQHILHAERRRHEPPVARCIHPGDYLYLREPVLGFLGRPQPPVEYRRASRRTARQLHPHGAADRRSPLRIDYGGNRPGIADQRKIRAEVAAIVQRDAARVIASASSRVIRTCTNGSSG